MAETGTIDRDLVCLNESGFLTINSQPRVLAASSDDPCFGWGGAGGLVYQKACVFYFEFSIVCFVCVCVREVGSRSAHTAPRVQLSLLCICLSGLVALLSLFSSLLLFSPCLLSLSFPSSPSHSHVSLSLSSFRPLPLASLSLLLYVAIRYVEFFCHPKLLSALIVAIEQQQKRDGFTHLSYLAADVAGNQYANYKVGYGF